MWTVLARQMEGAAKKLRTSAKAMEDTVFDATFDPPVTLPTQLAAIIANKLFTYQTRCEGDKKVELLALKIGGEEIGVYTKENIEALILEELEQPEWALRLIKFATYGDFEDGLSWAQWCRNVATAGLENDEDRLAWFERQITEPPNDQAELPPPDSAGGQQEKGSNDK